MTPTHSHNYSERQLRLMRKAVFIQVGTLAYMASLVVLMYIVMGSSQAMKAAWIEDVLGLVPPSAFLIYHYIRKKYQPSRYFPYGFHRLASVGFLVSSLALLIMGGYLIVDSALKLIEVTHPTVGNKSYFGLDIWSGWWMIGVLSWGTLPPVILGRMKMKIAPHLHDKILYTDAKMNKADWMTAVASMAGVLGIGFGLWWADSVAALFVAADIVKDGYGQTRDAVTELINRAPKDLKGEYLNLPKMIKARLEEDNFVKEASVRMYEHGDVFFGEAFVILNVNQIQNKKIIELRDKVKGLDWRIHDVTLTVAEAAESSKGSELKYG